MTCLDKISVIDIPNKSNKKRNPKAKTTLFSMPSYFKCMNQAMTKKALTAAIENAINGAAGPKKPRIEWAVIVKKVRANKAPATLRYVANGVI